MKFNFLVTASLRTVSLSFCLATITNIANAAIPQGYYDNVNKANSTVLKQTLHEIIDDHKRFPYTSSATDTWDILEAADQDPSNANNVIDIYKNASYAKVGGGNSNYNREHSWPKSYGFPKDGSKNYPYTDAHHLFIANSGYNSSRNNKPYANCDAACAEKATDFNNARGGGAGENNLTKGSGPTGTWQTWIGRKGDVARALMYLAVRYEGGTHGVTGANEPDLILTDDRNLIANSKTGANVSVAYMGLKSVLLQWHKDDPVDAYEVRHNNAVHLQQGNRNPFIDHPEFVSCIFENDCIGGDNIAPSAPTNLSATTTASNVTLNWTASPESDTAGYNIYRSNTSSSDFQKLNSSPITVLTYTDSSVQADQTYYYHVKAVDSSKNISNASNQISVKVQTTSANASNIWINEIHYDNDGSDQNEAIELAGKASSNLSGWKLIAYNSTNGQSYKTVTINAVIPDQSNGYGTVNVAFSALQNGNADGVALVDKENKVLQFISYEGVLTATNGPAKGMKSIDIGVSETSGTKVGHSLQLSGSGDKYSDFSWQVAALNTAGKINKNQSFSGESQKNIFTNNNVTAIPDNADVVSNIDVQRSGSAGKVSVSVNITHTYRGDISLSLIAPDGSSYPLKSLSANDSADNVIATYNVDVTGNAQGQWRLSIADNYQQDVGKLNQWSLTF